MSRFDDRDQAVDNGAALRDAEQDAPGLEIGGAAAVAQAAELMEPPQQVTAHAKPAVAGTGPSVATPATAQQKAPDPAEAAQPMVALSPDGGMGAPGGSWAASGARAATQTQTTPSAAVDAAMQLRASAALALHAALDEPAQRTPVALRRKKKRPANPTAAPAVEPETTQT